jgi:hypothetical protein
LVAFTIGENTMAVIEGHPDRAELNTLLTNLPQAAQADTVAVDLAALKVDFNALLAKLRAAGIIAP